MPPSPPISENFQKFFDEHYDVVFYWFRRQGLDPETGRDLAQETFMAAYKGFDSFRGEASPRTWALRIARNRFRNHLRDNATQKRKHQEAAPVESKDGDIEVLEVADPKAPNPESDLLDREKNKELHGALDALPTQMRQCLELRLSDLKYREIAAIMDISVETVKSHLYQARQRLRKDLGGEEDQ